MDERMNGLGMKPNIPFGLTTTLIFNDFSIVLYFYFSNKHSTSRNKKSYKNLNIQYFITNRRKDRYLGR